MIGNTQESFKRWISALHQKYEEIADENLTVEEFYHYVFQNVWAAFKKKTKENGKEFLTVRDIEALILECLEEEAEKRKIMGHL